MFTNPLPFVAFMVVDFGMAGNVDDAGYYAGWITGMFMAGKRNQGWREEGGERWRERGREGEER